MQVLTVNVEDSLMMTDFYERFVCVCKMYRKVMLTLWPMVCHKCENNTLNIVKAN